MLSQVFTTAPPILMDTKQSLLLVCQPKTKWKSTHSTSLRLHENRLRCHDNRRGGIKKKQNFLLCCLLTLNKLGSGHCKKENSLLSVTTQEPCHDSGNPSLLYNVSYISPATRVLDERERESFTTAW